MAALVDTNVLVYRFDSRFAGKQKIATEILRRGILEDSVRVPHQAIIEFIAAVTRPFRGHIILKQADALREAEEFLKQFTVLYPNEAILRNAIRGSAAYQLNHMRSTTGWRRSLPRIFSTIGYMGTVRVVNPFIGLRWRALTTPGRTAVAPPSGDFAQERTRYSRSFAADAGCSRTTMVSAIRSWTVRRLGWMKYWK